ncbi:3-oxoacyl-ACP reductase [Bordetella genomosp. 12]|uniref:3-oxoacyl-ACP reductase n=2 Tax=Bordetella genomosp. 12 TaxID=463035 RepID=A0A261VEZ9_9BORD|nr:SDR family NAD(P)-dependent oxidoreductase [Bordetella genomosp. 12]OZI72351.1 3-oxoacyl-ACP reductase [Bordetella genomosp. 12]
MNNRHAIVTGAANGLGLAIVQRLHASGARVTLWDTDTIRGTEAADSLGSHARFSTVDVTCAPTILAHELQQSIEAFGPVDVLINNAGIAGPNATAWEYPLEKWRQVIEINVIGVLQCCRAVLPGMIQGGYGRVVNIASIAGKEGNATASAYAASKGAVIAMTKSIAKELVGTGVLMNCIAPAAIETDIFKQNDQDFKNLLQSKIPMGRLGQPEELAALVAWMASEECSFNTGAVFDLSGGRATY